MPIRVALVDDDSTMLDLLRRRIQRGADMVVARTYRTAEHFLGELPELNVHVVLMDINMPDMDGIACVLQAKPKRPDVQFLMLTVLENPNYVFQALCAGATGYLLKSSTADELLDGIRDIHDGGSPMSRNIARLVVGSFQDVAQQRINDHLLTDREKEIIDGLAAGHMYKEIAAKLSISTGTVRKHVRNIYQKLQVSRRSEAVRKVYPPGSEGK
ncbi:MAG: response regulator transcription factor [Flavobacteriales bacterium]